MSASEDEFIPTRKSLLDRLANWEDNASWQDFFNTYWKLIYSVALKSGLSHSESQDVVQDTVLAVARSIGKFNYDPNVCAFKSWLLQVTRSKIANQFGKRKHCPASLDPILDDSSATSLLERAAIRPASPSKRSGTRNGRKIWSMRPFSMSKPAFRSSNTKCSIFTC
jgi:DNA-directed RNA polymerase specialized sigma24 family protein